MVRLGSSSPLVSVWRAPNEPVHPPQERMFAMGDEDDPPRTQVRYPVGLMMHMPLLRRLLVKTAERLLRLADAEPVYEIREIVTPLSGRKVLGRAVSAHATLGDAIDAFRNTTPRHSHFNVLRLRAMFGETAVNAPMLHRGPLSLNLPPPLTLDAQKQKDTQ